MRDDIKDKKICSQLEKVLSKWFAQGQLLVWQQWCQKICVHRVSPGCLPVLRILAFKTRADEYEKQIHLRCIHLRKTCVPNHHTHLGKCVCYLLVSLYIIIIYWCYQLLQVSVFTCVTRRWRCSRSHLSTAIDICQFNKDLSVTKHYSVWLPTLVMCGMT